MIEEPTPAGVHELVRNGHEVYVEKEAGVMATRYSWFLTSRGMPTFTFLRLLCRPVRATVRALPAG
jgi:hypothetical protein